MTEREFSLTTALARLRAAERLAREASSFYFSERAKLDHQEVMARIAAVIDALEPLVKVRAPKE